MMGITMYQTGQLPRKKLWTKSGDSDESSLNGKTPVPTRYGLS